MTFLETLRQNCHAYADKSALEFLDRRGQYERVSYRRLETIVKQTISYLSHVGLRPGDRVALQLPKCLPFIYLHLAIMRSGAITLPLNPDYPPRELAYFLDDAGARLFFADDASRDAVEGLRTDLPTLEEVVYLNCQDHGAFTTMIQTAGEPANLPEVPKDPYMTALMIYTSGTTGRPKGAMITHGNLTANIEALHSTWGWRDDDLLLHVLPIFHVHGLIVALHGALHAGASAILMPEFDPMWTLQTLQERRCTVFMAVPTIHRMLLGVPDAGSYDLSHMRLLTSGSDRLPDDVFHSFRETFGHRLLERYGMTETGMNLSNPLHGERRVGSVGKPLPGVAVRIVDPDTGDPVADGEVGELQIRGPHVCKGYWRQPEKTAEAFSEDGWLKTGDLGLREADGYFTLKGRSKDLIISGGLNVYPPEVEMVLAEHPGIAASAVIGCPDEKWGERVTALIVPVEDAMISEKSVVQFCRQRLASYKAPKEVLFVQEMPRNALGKVQKAQLRRNKCR